MLRRLRWSTKHVFGRNYSQWEKTSASLLADAFKKSKQLGLSVFPTEFQNAHVTSGADALEKGLRIQEIAGEMSGFHRMGWKIGATSKPAQNNLSLDTPFLGALYSERNFKSGDNVPFDDVHIRGIESEFAFTLNKNITARPTPYTETEVLSYVHSIIPSLEIVGTRISPSTPANKLFLPFSLVADFGGNHAIVRGPEFTKQVSELCERLDTTKVYVRSDGKVLASGVGSDVYGHPLKALTWFVNYMSAKNIALPEGSFICTGTCTGLLPLPHSGKIKVEYENLCEVSVQFS